MPKSKKQVVVPAPKKPKAPKFKLISYTLKAVIPVGQYANIQPEVTVQAATIEQAERAVMPYIETLFAKYRDGGVKPVEPVVTRPVAPTDMPPVTVVRAPMTVTPKFPIAPTGSVSPTPDKDGVSPSIPLSVPFNRAKGAMESCMSAEALKLVSDQVEKSTKLIDTEKVELRKLAIAKLEKINGVAK